MHRALQITENPSVGLELKTDGGEGPDLVALLGSRRRMANGTTQASACPAPIATVLLLASSTDARLRGDWGAIELPGEDAKNGEPADEWNQQRRVLEDCRGYAVAEEPIECLKVSEGGTEYRLSSQDGAGHHGEKDGDVWDERMAEHPQDGHKEPTENPAGTRGR